jgi:predicted DNA binding CopG/RHH family protein
MEINIIELVGDLNNKDFTKKQILEKYKITDYTFKKLLKTNGYKYNAKLNQWLLESENTDVDTTKVTYRIPTDLYKAIKLQSIFEGVTSTELITKVLETYIPKETKQIIQQNKK